MRLLIAQFLLLLLVGSSTAVAADYGQKLHKLEKNITRLEGQVRLYQETVETLSRQRQQEQESLQPFREKGEAAWLAYQEAKEQNLPGREDYRRDFERADEAFDRERKRLATVTLELSESTQQLTRLQQQLKGYQVAKKQIQHQYRLNQRDRNLEEELLRAEADWQTQQQTQRLERRQAAQELAAISPLEETIEPPAQNWATVKLPDPPQEETPAPQTQIDKQQNTPTRNEQAVTANQASDEELIPDGVIGVVSGGTIAFIATCGLGMLAAPFTGGASAAAACAAGAAPAVAAGAVAGGFVATDDTSIQPNDLLEDEGYEE